MEGLMRDVMTEEEAREFITALVVDYKKLKEKLECTGLRFIKLDVSKMSLEDFKATCKLVEKAYLEWKRLAKAAADLPADAKQEFGKEYARIAI